MTTWQFRPAACLAVLVLTGSSLLGAEDKLTPRPVLIAKGERYFVHALPTVGPPSSALRGATVGLQLLYTTAESGEMKVLMHTHGVTQSIRRTAHLEGTAIVGIVRDDERLYVAAWSGGSDLNDKDRGYRLLVYWLADGANIAERLLKGHDLPKTDPVETTGRGPLKVVEGGASLFGTTIRFKGKELAKPANDP